MTLPTAVRAAQWLMLLLQLALASPAAAGASSAAARAADRRASRLLRERQSSPELPALPVDGALHLTELERRIHAPRKPFMLVANRSVVVPPPRDCARARPVGSAPGRSAFLQGPDDAGGDRTGQKVWRSALALAAELEARPSLVAGKRVIELGTGHGLVSLAAALLGAASVLATDGTAAAAEYANATLRANLGAAELEAGQVGSGAYRWGEPLSTLSGRNVSGSGSSSGSNGEWDVVLASDVIYSVQAHAFLAAALELLLPAGEENCEKLALLAVGKRWAELSVSSGIGTTHAELFVALLRERGQLEVLVLVLVLCWSWCWWCSD